MLLLRCTLPRDSADKDRNAGFAAGHCQNRLGRDHASEILFPEKVEPVGNKGEGASVFNLSGISRFENRLRKDHQP